ncbi:MAG: DUF2203 domain-containing protein [Anaerolineae bacterium]
MGLKTFTLEEANSYIPQIVELLTEMQEARKQIVESAPEVQATLKHAGGNGGSKKASEHLLLLQRFQVAHATLTDIGCELKDLEMGLVDFPSYRNETLVYLCWKLGEPRVAYWHDLDTGLAGRQPLE